MAKTSPYLLSVGRLQDVIAAIQTMGTYKFYKLPFDSWADRISGDSTRGPHWRKVFEEHPEFFRLDRERKMASLVWRRQYPKRFHVDLQEQLPSEKFYDLPDEQKARVSRNPLSADDIKALLATAIDLHSRAMENQRDRRWWIPLASVAGGLLGALLGAALR